MRGRGPFLLFLWSIVTIFALVIYVLGQSLSPSSSFIPDTDDACLATCGHCNYKITDFRQPIPWFCCVWDHGCWLNPFEPDYQVSLCGRPISLCIITDPIFYSYECCEPAQDCIELNDAPCCEPYHTHPCP